MASKLELTVTGMDCRGNKGFQQSQFFDSKAIKPPAQSTSIGNNDFKLKTVLEWFLQGQQVVSGLFSITAMEVIFSLCGPGQQS